MESRQNTDSETRVELEETVPGQAEKGDAGIAMAETGTRWKLSTADEIIFYGLIILSLIGAVISQISVDTGRIFWLIMIPIIGIATVYIEWTKVRDEGVRLLTLVRTQLFHWGSLIVAVELVSLLAYFGRINNTAVSAMTLLLLAQVTFLVGVYVDWRFSVVAIFQVLCLIVLAYLETYIWAMLLVAAGIIALGVYFHRKFPQASARYR